MTSHRKNKFVNQQGFIWVFDFSKIKLEDFAVLKFMVVGKVISFNFIF